LIFRLPLTGYIGPPHQSAPATAEQINAAAKVLQSDSQTMQTWYDIGGWKLNFFFRVLNLCEIFINV
jgi:hypothetical protein